MCLRGLAGGKPMRQRVHEGLHGLASVEDSCDRDGRESVIAGECLKVLVLGVTLAVLQQWCGINVIFNYAC